MNKIANENNYIIYHGDCLKMLEDVQKESIDSIVTDPPYGLKSSLNKGFMGKEWDGSGIEYNPTTWKNCYEVLKPGGYLLAFGGARTYHKIATAIENAGFEIRDCIMWLYGSGFPKSMNIGLAIDKKNGVESEVIGEINTHDFSKHNGSMMSFSNTKEYKTKATSIYIKRSTNEWGGWGTYLKPAYEPIIVARKPFRGTLAENVLENGTGGINIDECRVGNEHFEIVKSDYGESKSGFLSGKTKRTPKSYNGRFPANVILDNQEGEEWRRYFYCAKASKKDRDEGLEVFETNTINDGRLKSIDNAFQRGETLRKNIHPTVKPTSLMQYLVRLVTPKGGTVLDPFMGSGSTGKAVMYENKERGANYKFVGIELEKEYIPIAIARIKFVN